MYHNLRRNYYWGKAEERKTLLESEMCEAEKWEGDVQQLFDGLESSDKILSARLEHDLTAEDLPNDTQVGRLF